MRGWGCVAEFPRPLPVGLQRTGDSFSSHLEHKEAALPGPSAAFV